MARRGGAERTGARGAAAAGNVQWPAPGRAGSTGKAAGAGLDDDGEGNEEEEELEFEVSQQFLDFVAKSAAHRKERDREKQEQPDYYIPGARGDGLRRDFAGAPSPEEAPGAARRRKMAGLYGPKTSQIEALEARLNLLHDDGVVKHAAKLWPALPLRLS